jgi:chlorite dismutase
MWKVDREWRRLDEKTRAAHKAEFEKAVLSVAGPTTMISTFSTAGLKTDIDFFIWVKSKDLAVIHQLGLAIRATEMSKWMDLTRNYLAMLKGSPYEQEKHDFVAQSEYKYLFIYPFVKTRPWYLLPIGERMRIMKGHIDGAAAYTDVRINTSYSFGIDDQDFVVSFEADDPSRFVNLVQELRETESSLYTQRDTPMYVGLKQELKDILATL